MTQHNEMLAMLKEIAELRRRWESMDDTETIDSIDYMDSLQALAIDELIAKAEGGKP